MARHKSRRCAHGHGATLCFECFRAGSERTKARQEAWAQRALPFEADGGAARARELSEQEIAHRRRMLAYLQSAARRGA
jgi:hypothetical protein